MWAWWRQMENITLLNAYYIFDCFGANWITPTSRITIRADSRLAPSQWEASLQSNVFSHWLNANLESALTVSEREHPLCGRHNECDGVSNHHPDDCLLKRLFRRGSKKTSKLRVTGFERGIHRWPVKSLHKGPGTRKMFAFDDVIMVWPADGLS